MRNASPGEGLALKAQGGDIDNLANSAAAAAPTTHQHDRRRRPELTEPVKVAEFWKNRRGESVRVSLSTYEGNNLVDIRQCFTNEAGQMQATKKGVAMSVQRLPDLLAAVTKAVTMAAELGLIDKAAR